MAGLYFEEFKVGMIFDHPMHRTITEADNVLFSTMTHNPSALHLDAEYMKKSQYGQRLVNSCLTLSLMVGISIGDTTLGTTIANLGWDKVRFPKPLFHGDTIRVQTEVLEVRESRSKPDRGYRDIHSQVLQSTRRRGRFLFAAGIDDEEISH